MSIAKQISEAIDHVVAGDVEGAFVDACIALDATATKEYGEEGRGPYKQFIRENLELITRATFGHTGITGALRIEFSHPRIKADADGLCGIEDILYHAVRCGLLHSTKLPDNIGFGPSGVLQVSRDGKLLLPQSIIDGLILAVVASPVNADERVPVGYAMNGRDLNELWGERDVVLAFLKKLQGGNCRPDEISAGHGTCAPGQDVTIEGAPGQDMVLGPGTYRAGDAGPGGDGGNLTIKGGDARP